MRLLTLDPANGISSAIAAALLHNGFVAAPDGAECDAALVDSFDVPDDFPFDALRDEDFDAVALAPTLDRVELLHRARATLEGAGNIVVVGSNAYLGRWHGVAQAAASAAMVGLVRSIAQEFAPQGIRVNLLALPHDTTPANAGLIEDAAQQAKVLLRTRTLTGTTILMDDGGNLKFRQARRR
jgi:NAD(P)-dependent dehydrogenase (short-subunit alcohol dehydrogenase family)